MSGPDGRAAAAWRFALPETPAAPIAGEAALYPVRRVFCVGRNYAEHAREMGVEVDRQAPFYFTKSASAVVVSGARTAYPPGTGDYQFEMELVLALGELVFEADLAQAAQAIFGFACGLDMTRRDLQLEARAKQRPWDLGKDVESSAVIAAITPAAGFAPGEQAIQLEVNGVTRQQARLCDLVWSPPELVSHLSRYYHLGPGDLIYTGTPAGVGPVWPGDRIVGRIDGLAPVELEIGPAP